ncbi:MAG: histidine kinase, partial [Acidimicrobiia bacterium]
MTDPGLAPENGSTSQEQTLVRILRTAAVIGGALALAGALAIVANGDAESLWSNLLGLFVVYSLFFMIVSWLVVPHQPRNPVAWTMASAALFSGLFIAGIAAASRLVDDPHVILGGAEHAVPADLPGSAAVVLMFSEPALLLAIFPLLTFGLLLFPDGKLPSPRWLWVSRLAGASLVVVTVAYSWAFRPGNTEPAEEAFLVDVGFIPVLLSVILSVLALIVRYRRTSGVIRQQFKWVVWGASIFGLTMVFVVSLGGSQHQDLIPIPLMVSAFLFLSSYGIAVGKYRLYDIDVVISRSVTYLFLAVALTTLYGVAAAAYIEVFADAEQRRTGDLGLALPIGATLLVAIAFEPLRSRMQRLANRLVYGKRAAPHEVLSQLTAQLADGSAGGSLDALAGLLREGTAADHAVVWLRVGNRLRAEAASPTEALGRYGELEVDGGDASTDLALSVPVRHGDETLGSLMIFKSPAHPVTSADRSLLSDVAAGAGLVLRNMSLNAQLQERADQVRASRQRLIAAQDAERHSLERNLHDGAQQQVVALKVKLGLARTIAEREGAGEVAASVAGLADDTQDAVD